MQSDKIQELKKNPQQQKMLNEIFAALNDSLKKEFTVYAKLVQADISNVMLQNAVKEGASIADIKAFSDVINQIVCQVGKDMDKQLLAQFENLKNSN